MLKYSAVVIVTLLFCLTEPGQQLLLWLDSHIDVEGMVNGAMALVQSIQQDTTP